MLYGKSNTFKADGADHWCGQVRFESVEHSFRTSIALQTHSIAPKLYKNDLNQVLDKASADELSRVGGKALFQLKVNGDVQQLAGRGGVERF